jgi:hypothetical protein
MILTTSWYSIDLEEAVAVDVADPVAEHGVQQFQRRNRVGQCDGQR